MIVSTEQRIEVLCEIERARQVEEWREFLLNELGWRERTTDRKDPDGD